jgi:hypothetical protein
MAHGGGSPRFELMVKGPHRRSTLCKQTKKEVNACAKRAKRVFFIDFALAYPRTHPISRLGLMASEEFSAVHAPLAGRLKLQDF